MMVRMAGYIRPTARNSRAGPTNETACTLSPRRPLNLAAISRMPMKTMANSPRATNIWTNLPVVDTGTSS